MAVGLAAGTAAALLLGRFVESFLFAAEPHDPTVFLAASTILTASALTAAWLPSRRAGRVRPTGVLRAE